MSAEITKKRAGLRSLHEEVLRAKAEAERALAEWRAVEPRDTAHPPPIARVRRDRWKTLTKRVDDLRAQITAEQEALRDLIASTPVEPLRRLKEPKPEPPRVFVATTAETHNRDVDPAPVLSTPQEPSGQAEDPAPTEAPRVEDPPVATAQPSPRASAPTDGPLFSWRKVTRFAAEVLTLPSRILAPVGLVASGFLQAMMAVAP